MQCEARERTRSAATAGRGYQNAPTDGARHLKRWHRECPAEKRRSRIVRCSFSVTPLMGPYALRGDERRAAKKQTLRGDDTRTGNSFSSCALRFHCSCLRLPSPLPHSSHSFPIEFARRSDTRSSVRARGHSRCLAPSVYDQFFLSLLSRKSELRSWFGGE